MGRTKIFLINGIVLTVTTLVMRSIGFVFNIYIAKKVGSEAVGVFGLVMSVYLFAITFATSGLSLACTYLVSEKLAKKDYSCGINILKTCISYACFLGVTAMFFLILFAPIISKICLKDKINVYPIYSIAIGLPLIAISSVIGGFFNSIGKAFKNSISQTFELTVKMVVTIIILNFYFSNDINKICTMLILADVVSEIASFLLNIIFYKLEKRNFNTSSKCSDKVKKKILKISFPVAITSYIRSGLSSFKQFLIPTSLEKSGISYSLAISNYGIINGMVMPILMFFSVFITSFASLLVPEFSRLLAGNNHNRMKYVCETIFKNSFIFSIGIGSILFFFSSEISYAIYQNLSCDFWIKILSPLVIFMYIDTIIDNLLKGINESFWVMCCNIIDLVTTITILYFLVPILGMTGYIFSIYVSEILNFTISNFQLKKKIPFKLSLKKFILLPFISSILSYFLTNLIKIIFNNFIWFLIFKMLIYLILYILILLIFYKIKNICKNN